MNETSTLVEYSLVLYDVSYVKIKSMYMSCTALLVVLMIATAEISNVQLTCAVMTALIVKKFCGWCFQQHQKLSGDVFILKNWPNVVLLANTYSQSVQIFPLWNYVPRIS